MPRTHLVTNLTLEWAVLCLPWAHCRDKWNWKHKSDNWGDCLVEVGI